MRGRTVRARGAGDEAAGRGGLLELPGLNEARRWWLDRAGDEAGRSGKRPDRLDPARGSHGEESLARRRHGGEDLVPIPLDGTGAGGVTGAGAEGRVVAAHAGHRVRDSVVPLEEAQRGTGYDRLGQEEGSQRSEREAAGAQGLKHRRVR